MNPACFKPFDALPDPIVAISQDGRIIYASAAACALLGYTCEEITMLPWNAVEETYSLVSRKASKAVTNDMYRHEVSLTHKDGHCLPMRITRNLFEHNGESAWIYRLLPESGSNQAYHSFTDHSAFVENIARFVPGAIYQFKIDTSGKMSFPYISPGYEKLCNVPAYIVKQAPERGFEAIHPEDIESLMESIEISRRTLDPWSHEFRFMNPTGDPVWVLGHSMPILQEDGSTVWHGVLTDISEVRRSQNALKQSEELFSKVADNSYDAIILLDSSGNTRYWNKAAERIFGYKREEILGKELHRIIMPEEGMPHYRAGLGQFARSGEGGIMGTVRELEAIRKGGQPISVEIAVTGIQVDGEWNAIGVLRDITERKQVEQELVDAKESAEKASAAKSAFLAMVSHELRTPLTPIIALSDMLCESPLPQATSEPIKMIRKASHKLQRLIQNILDISRIEAGKIDIQYKPSNLYDIIDNAIETARHMGAGKDIDISAQIESDVPERIYTDDMRLGQILMNLIGNGVKYTEQGSVTLLCERIECPERESSHHRLRFTIRDTGIGLPEGQIESLFETFVQADNSLTREYSGSGLGLTISRKLADMLGGQLHGKNNPEGGASFILELTVTEAQLPQENVDKKVDYSQLTDKRVLLVEDNAENIQAFNKLIEGSGILLDIATDGPSGVHKACAHQYEIILMDMRLPHMHGREAIRRICDHYKSLDACNCPAIVVLSAEASDKPEEITRELCLSGYISKPFTRKELFDTILEVLEG